MAEENVKTIFMTGGTSGLGREAVLELASQGYRVLVLSRDEAKGEALLEEFREKHRNEKGSIELVDGDLNSFESIVTACDIVKQKTDHLDLLINNAGIMNFKFEKSSDGIEQTLQVNLLSPLLISHLLWQLLKGREDAKIIFTASALHSGTINFEDIEFREKFVSFKSYSQSKLGLILMVRYLADTLSDEGIGIYTQHPGMVKTNLGRSAGLVSRLIFQAMGKSPEMGARNLLFLVRAHNKDLSPGGYYADQKLEKTTDESYDMNMAQELHHVCRKYLRTYLHDTSPFFPVDTLEELKKEE